VRTAPTGPTTGTGPTTPTRCRRAGLPLAVALAATAVAGCSSDPGGSGTAAPPTHSASPGDVKAAPGLPKGVKGLTRVPADVPNDPALRARVAVASCKAVDGGWQAGGTASNPGRKPATYRITVFFTTATATVVGAARTSITVEPGAKQAWSVSDRFTAPKDTLCVLRGVG